MIIFVCFLIVPIVFASQQAIGNINHVNNISTNIDLLNGQNLFNEEWMNNMIQAPAAINLLGQILVVASAMDVSLKIYEPDHVYKYMKYPESLRATVLQVSNEGYHAFLGVHSAINKIQLYLKQIPQHMETITKVISSKASEKLINRMVSRSINNIERITNTCIELTRAAEDSFISVINLLGEVVEITKTTDCLYQNKTDSIELEINSTHHQRYEKIRQFVRNTSKEYFRILQAIPPQFKSLTIEYGRAAVKLLNAFRQGYISEERGQCLSAQDSFSGNGEKPSFATGQIINFLSHFGESLNSLIKTLSKNDKRNDKELEAYKMVFKSFGKMLKNFPRNKLAIKGVQTAKRAIKLVDSTIKNKDAKITDKLEDLADDIKSSTDAEQVSSTNTELISVSSDNKSLKGEFVPLDITNIRFRDTFAMLKQEFLLLNGLKKNWNDLFLLFTRFSNKVVRKFSVKIEESFGQTNSTLDVQQSPIDRKLILQGIKNETDDLNHESHVLSVLSSTYYDISSKYLMPRVSSLSIMLASSNNDQRQTLFTKLQQDMKEVQNEIKKLIVERKKSMEKQSEKKVQKSIE